MKLQPFDSNYFCGKIHFEDDSTQCDLVFQTVFKCFKAVANTNEVKSI